MQYKGAEPRKTLLFYKQHNITSPTTCRCNKSQDKINIGLLFEIEVCVKCKPVTSQSDRCCSFTVCELNRDDRNGVPPFPHSPIALVILHQPPNFWCHHSTIHYTGHKNIFERDDSQYDRAATRGQHHRVRVLDMDPTYFIKPASCIVSHSSKKNGGVCIPLELLRSVLTRFWALLYLSASLSRARFLVPAVQLLYSPSSTDRIQYRGQFCIYVGGFFSFWPVASSRPSTTITRI